jgi:hypothetical protein
MYMSAGQPQGAEQGQATLWASHALALANAQHLFLCLQDRRKELSKKVSKMGEDGKVAVRNVRKDILKRLDK